MFGIENISTIKESNSDIVNSCSLKDKNDCMNLVYGYSFNNKSTTKLVQYKMKIVINNDITTTYNYKENVYLKIEEYMIVVKVEERIYIYIK